MLLANGLSTFSKSPESLPKNPSDYTILCNWVFENFILVDSLFAKALWGFETCTLVNNNLCRKNKFFFQYYNHQQYLMKDLKLFWFHFHCRFQLKLKFQIKCWIR